MFRFCGHIVFICECRSELLREAGPRRKMRGGATLCTSWPVGRRSTGRGCPKGRRQAVATADPQPAPQARKGICNAKSDHGMNAPRLADRQVSHVRRVAVSPWVASLRFGRWPTIICCLRCALSFWIGSRKRHGKFHFSKSAYPAFHYPRCPSATGFGRRGYTCRQPTASGQDRFRAVAGPQVRASAAAFRSGSRSGGVRCRCRPRHRHAGAFSGAVDRSRAAVRTG